jgi:hypothetical protein
MMDLKSKTTKFRSNTRFFDEEKTEALAQNQLAEAELNEVKDELRNYEHFFQELYEFFSQSEANDLVAAGLQKMRKFSELHKPEVSKPSIQTTPDLKQRELKSSARFSKSKSVHKINASPYHLSKSTRKAPVKTYQMATPRELGKASLGSPAPSSWNCLDQLETAAEKLEFIKLRTLEVLQAWGAKSSR